MPGCLTYPCPYECVYWERYSHRGSNDLSVGMSLLSLLRILGAQRETSEWNDQDERAKGGGNICLQGNLKCESHVFLVFWCFWFFSPPAPPAQVSNR